MTMPVYCFDYNVYKQSNVNMVIRSWQHHWAPAPLRPHNMHLMQWKLYGLPIIMSFEVQVQDKENLILSNNKK